MIPCVPKTRVSSVVRLEREREKEKKRKEKRRMFVRMYARARDRQENTAVRPS